jgi:lysine-specific demethylase 3
LVHRQLCDVCDKWKLKSHQNLTSVSIPLTSDSQERVNKRSEVRQVTGVKHKKDGLIQLIRSSHKSDSLIKVNLQTDHNVSCAIAQPMTVQPQGKPIPDVCVQHRWLDNGRLLELFESTSDEALSTFRYHWQQAGPVIVSGCEKHFDQSLWQPESFESEFGNQVNELVDCGNNVLLLGCQMKKFWCGFDNISRRLVDECGNPRILKLKDWPPREDFADVLPSRFRDIMNALPFPEYTHRNGVFNIVSLLPEYFDRPDLGPKLYVAYGSALYPDVGSTNLHLDISDAANIMLYVAMPTDDITRKHERAAIEAMLKARCCPEIMSRAAQEPPGALWHIYKPQDTDKIRQLLTKVSLEKGQLLEPHHDPIHDQTWYLDEVLRDRLQAEYGVVGCTFVQFVGDTVFIPAGAAHQVRNLHSCIKAAEDFVSPENLGHCLRMMQEFRHLSRTHNNHEDKLQVKNVIYHCIKDAVAVLEAASCDL